MNNNNPEILQEFFYRFFPEESQAMDFETTMHIEKSFLNPEYHVFMYDIVHSLMINGKKGYSYVTLEYGEKISKQLYNIIIDEAKRNLTNWHNQLHPENQNPNIILPKCRFSCDLKSKTKAG